MDPSEKDTTPPPSEPQEEDLSQLLDSCIEDFNKPLPKPTHSTQAPPTSTENSPSAWSSEFKDFSDMMGNLIGDPSEIEEMQKLMNGCLAQNMDNPSDEDAFSSSFADTIRQLTEQVQNVPEPTPDEMAALLGNLDMQGAVGDLEGMPELMPLMQGVMQRLMSKELLYPSIKEITNKYPDWLSKNKPSLDVQEYNKYQSQFTLMQQICEEFEIECPDSEEEQKKQFERVLQLMQKIQEFGNPPKELVSSIGPGIPLDDQGNLQIPGMPSNCTVM